MFQTEEFETNIGIVILQFYFLQLLFLKNFFLKFMLYFYH